ncbi:terminase small subunit [Mucilaginibacter sp.]
MKTQSFKFQDGKGLAACIKNYFTYIEGVYRLETVPVKASLKTVTEETTEQKVWERPPEPPTLSGLAHFLGFESRKAFEAHAARSKYTRLLRRARLKIEAEYEKKLHYQSSTGAIFALKNMGWLEKATAHDTATVMTVTVNDAGPVPASKEQEVNLEPPA